MGNPLDKKNTLGPVANIQLANKIREQTEVAIASGARALIDSSIFLEDNGTYVMPQILVEINHSISIMRDENFGPIVGIM